MTCPDWLDQLFVRVHWPIWLDSEVLVEGEKVVQLSGALTRRWYLLWFCIWLGPWWLLAGGHWNPMVGHPELLPMHRFVAARQI